MDNKLTKKAMIEYLPWSKKVASQCLEKYVQGQFAILDIELGGQCNYNCIYCDSPCREKICNISYEKLEKAFQTNNVDWVFICGLGEPTALGNKKMLCHILHLCETYGAKCSIFTNLSNLSSDIIEYIKKGVLHLLFKYDSKDFIKNMKLYGVSTTHKQICNIERIKDMVSVNDGCTNLAASIVPTRTNKDEIIEVVKDCLSHNIYPLIAELENSGDAQDYYSQLALTNSELLEIKNEVSKLIGEEYVVPVCPAVISGIHIRHDGWVTVDEYTGLSCHWFWLEEPKTKNIGNFNEERIEVIVEKIEKERDQKLPIVVELTSKMTNKVFGGCGGDVNLLTNQYIKAKERQKNDLLGS